MVFNPNPKPYRPKPFRPGQPRQFGQPRPAPYVPKAREEEQPKEDEHFWTVEQWEEWATNEYYNNPEATLPEWFVNEMEKEQQESKE